MRPLAFLYGTGMFFPPRLKASGRLANVYFFAFFTSIPIDAFLFHGVDFSLILVAKNVSELSARFEAGVDTSFGESTFYTI